VNRPLICFCVMVGSAFCAPAIAQDSNKARLDDFAIPSTAQSPKADQVTSGRDAPQPAQVLDRTLGRPSRSEPAGEMPVQLSNGNQGGEVTQVATRNQSRSALSGAVANPGDRVPGAVQRIGGHDRCDPQQEKRLYAECLRILELRADEFQAPGPAVLSPEQRLLGEMRQPNEQLTGSSSGVRMRYATNGQPDADLQSNQELASVFLATPPASQLPAETEAEKAINLGEVLQALGIQVVNPQGN
jgi:hypothetical protein